MSNAHEVSVISSHRPGIHAVTVRSSRALGRHTHDQFGIGFMTAGAHESESGRGYVQAEAGNLITVNPNEVHDGRPIGDGGRHWHTLYFDAEHLAPIFREVTDGRTAGAEFAFPVTAGRALSEAFHGLWEALAHDEAGNEMTDEAIQCDLLSLVGGLLDSKPKTVDGAVPIAIRRAIERIDAAPECAVSLAELADNVGCSRFHLIRLFKAATGLPPHSYRLQRQLQKARRLLATVMSPAQVAADTGFSDQSHMTRHFTRAYGYGPGAYGRAIASRL